MQTTEQALLEAFNRSTLKQQGITYEQALASPALKLCLKHLANPQHKTFTKPSVVKTEPVISPLLPPVAEVDAWYKHGQYE